MNSQTTVATDRRVDDRYQPSGPTERAVDAGTRVPDYVVDVSRPVQPRRIDVERRAGCAIAEEFSFRAKAHRKRLPVVCQGTVHGEFVWQCAGRPGAGFLSRHRRK